MPKKYEGEPELSKREKKIKEMAAEIAAERELLKKPFLMQHLKAAPKPVGEIQKQQGKPEPMKPEDIKEFWKQREDRKKQTFKYRPMA